MDQIIRETQLKLLEAFSKINSGFALAGGTALEVFYLNHRFSRDLDFFSPKYDLGEIDKIIKAFSRAISKKPNLENEFFTSNHAKVRFYTVKVGGSSYPLKIDFVQDVIFNKPNIKRFNKVRVYAAKNIYLQKIMAITGTKLAKDDIGREITSGRQEIRDMVDLYYLSKKILLLHDYIKNIPHEYQRGMVRWYHTFSRQEFKLGFLDLELYDKKLDSMEVIRHLEAEIKKFISEELK